MWHRRRALSNEHRAPCVRSVPLVHCRNGCASLPDISSRPLRFAHRGELACRDRNADRLLHRPRIDRHRRRARVDVVAVATPPCAPHPHVRRAPLPFVSTQPVAPPPSHAATSSAHAFQPRHPIARRTTPSSRQPVMRFSTHAFVPASGARCPRRDDTGHRSRRGCPTVTMAAWTQMKFNGRHATRCARERSSRSTMRPRCAASRSATPTPTAAACRPTGFRGSPVPPAARASGCRRRRANRSCCSARWAIRRRRARCAAYSNAAPACLEPGHHARTPTSITRPRACRSRPSCSGATVHRRAGLRRRRPATPREGRAHHVRRAADDLHRRDDGQPFAFESGMTGTGGGATMQIDGAATFTREVTSQGISLPHHHASRTRRWTTRERTAMKGMNANTGRSISGLDHFYQSIGRIVTTPLASRETPHVRLRAARPDRDAPGKHRAHPGTRPSRGAHALGAAPDAHPRRARRRRRECGRRVGLSRHRRLDRRERHGRVDPRADDERSPA